MSRVKVNLLKHAHGHDRESQAAWALEGLRRGSAETAKRSGKPLTPAEAMALFLETPRGRALYGLHTNKYADLPVKVALKKLVENHEDLASQLAEALDDPWG